MTDQERVQTTSVIIILADDALDRINWVAERAGSVEKLGVSQPWPSRRWD